MLGTKIEIKMRKAEPGSWCKLDFPKAPPAIAAAAAAVEPIGPSETTFSLGPAGDSVPLSDHFDAVDLSDL
jgi:hypothetical protein